jgi:hypothetical protein
MHSCGKNSARPLVPMDPREAGLCVGTWPCGKARLNWTLPVCWTPAPDATMPTMREADLLVHHLHRDVDRRVARPNAPTCPGVSAV